MNLDNLHVGDVAFGAIPTYNGNFQKGWKVKEFKVVRKTKNYIWISFDRYTDIHPQRLSASKAELIARTKEQVWKALQKKENLKYLPKKYMPIKDNET